MQWARIDCWLNQVGHLAHVDLSQWSTAELCNCNFMTFHNIFEAAVAVILYIVETLTSSSPRRSSQGRGVAFTPSSVCFSLSSHESYCPKAHITAIPGCLGVNQWLIKSPLLSSPLSSPCCLPLQKAIVLDGKVSLQLGMRYNALCKLRQKRWI